MIERVVLVGYLGSGKSVVGRALARRLEWDYADFDAEIERRTGRPLRDLVDEEGAENLSAREAVLTEEVVGRSHVVLAPGGGWITRPELLASLGSGTLTVWLQASPSAAYERVLRSGIDHPLRDLPDALDRMGEMMRKREPLYNRADMAIPTDGRPVEAIAFEIEQLVRTRESLSYREVRRG